MSPRARLYCQTTYRAQAYYAVWVKGSSQVLFEESDAAAEARFHSPSPEELEVIGLLRSLERPRMPENVIDLRRIESVIDLRAGLRVE